jgi:tRNA pseudouridine55 synthase
MSYTFNFLEGELLLINKPKGWTSFDVVNKIRYMIRFRTGSKDIKVGHAGTLDPLATGLLIVCTGKKTKEIGELVGMDKEYTGTFTMGATTPSLDLETPISETFDYKHIAKEDMLKVAKYFTGSFEQVPPAYSAKKHKGKRAYEFARENEEVTLQPQLITVDEFEIKKVELPTVEFRIVCSKGTYIRALARDFGKALHSGAYLSSLCRTRIGEFELEDAINIDQLQFLIDAQLS